MLSFLQVTSYFFQWMAWKYQQWHGCFFFALAGQKLGERLIERYLRYLLLVGAIYLLNGYWISLHQFILGNNPYLCLLWSKSHQQFSSYCAYKLMHVANKYMALRPLTFDLSTPKSNQFIFVSQSILDPCLNKIPSAVHKLSRLQADTCGKQVYGPVTHDLWSLTSKI